MRLVFWAMVLFFVGLSGVWVHLNRGPTHWDDSWYLNDSLLVFDAMSDHGVVGWGHALLYLVQERYKAPLMCALPTPIYMVFGRIPKAAFFVNLAFIPLLLWSVFAIARRWWGGRVALMAVFITGTLPQLFGLTTWYLVEYGLAALVAGAIWCLIESEDLTGTGWVVGFSVACGLGMLQKILFPVYVLPIFIYYAARWVGRVAKLPAGGNASTPWPVKTLAAVVIPAVILAGPWYALNYRAAIDRAIYSGYSHQEADLYGTGDPFTVGAVYKYGLKLINEGVGASYFFIALVAGIGAMLVRSRQGIASRQGRLAMLLWGLPFGVFLFAHNKDVRFVAPLLPIFAIGLAIALARLGRAWGSELWVMLILLVPFAFLIQLAFEPLGTRFWSIGGNPANVQDDTMGIHFLGWDLGEIRMYEQSEWPLNKVVEEVARLRPTIPGEPSNVMIGCDSLHFNCNNLQLTARQERLPMVITTDAYYQDPASLLENLRSMQFFLYRDRAEPTNASYNRLAEVALNEVRHGGNFEEIRSSITFPDQGILYIYRNKTGPTNGPDGVFIPARLGPIQACDVLFSDKIRLTGVGFEREGQVLHARYRWQCVTPIDRQYECFVHLVDEKGKTVGYFDHDVLMHRPPMTSWKVGDSAWEAFDYDLSQIETGGRLSVEMGLFVPKINEPLYVASPDLSKLPGWLVMDRKIGLHIDLDAFAVKQAP